MVLIEIKGGQRRPTRLIDFDSQAAACMWLLKNKYPQAATTLALSELDDEMTPLTSADNEPAFYLWFPSEPDD